MNALLIHSRNALRHRTGHGFLDSFITFFRRSGFFHEVQSATSIEDAEKYLEDTASGDLALVVVCSALEGEWVKEFCRRAGEKHPGLKTLLLSGHPFFAEAASVMFPPLFVKRRARLSGHSFFAEAASVIFATLFAKGRAERRALEEAKERAKERILEQFGCQDFLARPFDMRKLQRKLAKMGLKPVAVSPRSV